MSVRTFALILLLIGDPAFSACDDLAQLPERVRRERISSWPGFSMERACIKTPGPVAAALQALEEAKVFLDPDDREARAYLDLALSDYYYRAEAGEREFPLATEYGQRAHRIFAELDDPVALTKDRG